jgi:hypothetical protein
MTLPGTALSVVLDVNLGMWLGGMVFFLFVGAPTTFDVLGDDAGRVVNAIFPKYYEFGSILGFTAISAAILAWNQDVLDPTATLFIQPLILIALATTIYAQGRLLPKMEAAGDDGFARYHKQSVVLNGVTMLAVAGALVLSHV